LAFGLDSHLLVTNIMELFLKLNGEFLRQPNEMRKIGTNDVMHPYPRIFPARPTGRAGWKIQSGGVEYRRTAVRGTEK